MNMRHLNIIDVTTLIFLTVQLKRLVTGHVHHSDYQVHHRMGQMKIKVKPEGAKLIFTGGDLDVHLHPAHGYVRPVHNVVLSHSVHVGHYDDDFHHGIEHEEEEVGHSGFHEWHHSYHHDDHGGHDDDGYGFRHFHHWPNSLHGEHSFLGHDFYHDHHGDHHGHFRDEIGDSDGNDDDHRLGVSRYNINGEDRDGKKSNEEATTEQSEEQGYQRSIDNSRNDAVIFGKKIYPDDSVKPTFKSQMEQNLEKFSAKIAPHYQKQKEEIEGGSGRGTISPFDEDNDTQDNRVNEDQRDQGRDTGGDAGERSEEEGGDRFGSSKQNIRELQRFANRMKPDIPSEEDEIPVRESSSNTKDIGSPSRIFVNMSGEPHNYGEEGRLEDYPAPSRSLRPDVADNDNEQQVGDYYPNNEEESWSIRPHDDNEDDSEGYKKSLAEFQIHSQKMLEIAEKGVERRTANPPVVVQPDGDPRNGNLEKAFYDFHPIRQLSQHLATMRDFNVRSRIDKHSPHREKRNVNRTPRDHRRNLIANKLIQRLRKSW